MIFCLLVITRERLKLDPEIEIHLLPFTFWLGIYLDSCIKITFDSRFWWFWFQVRSKTRGPIFWCASGVAQDGENLTRTADLHEIANILGWNLTRRVCKYLMPSNPNARPGSASDSNLNHMHCRAEYHKCGSYLIRPLLSSTFRSFSFMSTVWHAFPALRISSSCIWYLFFSSLLSSNSFSSFLLPHNCYPFPPSLFPCSPVVPVSLFFPPALQYIFMLCSDKEWDAAFKICFLDTGSTIFLWQFSFTEAEGWSL